jgi:hypothetical protein
MKITSQSAEELVLQEGSTAGLIVGGAFVIAGPLVGYFLRQSSPYAIWIGLALLAVGILIVLFASSITVVANKKSGQVSYQKKRLIGAQNFTYAISDIFRIETRKTWQVDNTPVDGNQGGARQQPVLVAQSIIVFKDGREMALDHQKNSSSTSVGSMVMTDGQGNETAVAARVAEFLGVPFQEIMPPNMSGGMNINFS